MILLSHKVMNKSLYKTGRKEMDKAMNEKKEKKTKPITLCDYHKARLAGMASLFVMEVLTLIFDHVKVSGGAGLRALNYALIIISLVLLVRWAFMSLIKKRPIEKEDELSRENMMKAHEKIGLVFWLILGAVLILSMFWKGSITIHFDNELMNSIWFIIFSGYFSLESGFFIYYDRTAAGDDCDDDDDDEESAGDE